MRHDLPVHERLIRAANALIVVDMVWDSKIPQGDDLATRIRTFINSHDDEYKVIVANKPVWVARFHPKLQAFPDYITEPYDPTNIDFDSVFVGKWNDKRYNDRGESLDRYLSRHGIGHVDIVGVHVGEFALEVKRWGYSETVLLQMCVGDLSPETILGFADELIEVEGLTQ